MGFKHVTSCALFALASFCAGATEPAQPFATGPESVQEWYRAGTQFISAAKARRPIEHRAKNVILFVGDGMGISTITAARILDGQMKGRPGEENQLFFETLPYVALSKTYTWDQQTPDSAPTMTAMVTGYKTRDGMLSVNHLTARGECDAAALAPNVLPTILEQAAAAGKASGVVSTARITHATPAATYAHTAMRDWESDAQLPAGCGVRDIARQLIELPPKTRNSLKVVLGGGRDYFRSGLAADPEYPDKNGMRKDGRDLTAEWLATRGKNARYVWNMSDFAAINPVTTPFLLGLFERSHMRYEAERVADKAGEPSLTEMTTKAIAMLKRNQHGFFLHVEGGRIDHGHHAGNARLALRDAIEFDRAVKKAYEMTDPNETLIIVTADHSHVFTIAGYPRRGNPILGLVHEAPDRDGDPTTLSRDRYGLPYTTLGYANGPGWRSDVGSEGKRPDLTHVDTAAPDFLQEATVPLKSETHGGEDVAIYASGPRAHLIHGTMEQNWIYHVMKHAFGF